jgi:hypothetical protein
LWLTSQGAIRTIPGTQQLAFGPVIDLQDRERTLPTRNLRLASVTNQIPYSCVNGQHHCFDASCSKDTP